MTADLADLEALHRQALAKAERTHGADTPFMRQVRQAGEVLHRLDRLELMVAALMEAGLPREPDNQPSDGKQAKQDHDANLSADRINAATARKANVDEAT